MNPWGPLDRQEDSDQMAEDDFYRDWNAVARETGETVRVCLNCGEQIYTYVDCPDCYPEPEVPF